MVGVPTLFAGMLRIAEEKIGQERVRRACHRLRLCISGGEILPAALLDRWKQFAGVEILDGVGTTEMTHMFILNRPGKSVPGSCGRIVSGYRAELVDDDEKPVKTGEIGNLRMFGPSAAEQYWNKPEKTAEVMGRGGVLTGDKLYQDEDGNFFLVGRSDDMLRVGGIWVSPAEVEGAIAQHAAVMECAVVGHPDAEDMIKPKAYVVLREKNADTSGPDRRIAQPRSRAPRPHQMPALVRIRRRTSENVYRQNPALPVAAAGSSGAIAVHSGSASAALDPIQFSNSQFQTATRPRSRDAISASEL